MFSIAGSSVSMPSLAASFKQGQVSSGKISGLKLVSAPLGRASFPLRRSYMQRSLLVCCAFMIVDNNEDKTSNSIKAKPETVEKVVGIVRKQLAVPPESVVDGQSKFTDLGADSLDTVEIVMGLEEEFGINVEEDSAQSITTVQEAADLIETLISEDK